jgi:hypothetical protein
MRRARVPRWVKDAFYFPFLFFFFLQEETNITVDAKETGCYGLNIPVDDTLQYVIVDVMASYVRGEVQAGDDAANAVFADRATFDALPVHPETVEMIKATGIYKQLS